MIDPHGRTAQGSMPCTTHHRACDCREAVHREVAEALRIAVQSMEWVMWNRLDYTQEEIAANLELFLDALERYNEMYPSQLRVSPHNT